MTDGDFNLNSGINGTIFAYGQTASGKTYTMMGGEDEPGLVKYAVDEVFNAVQKVIFTVAEVYSVRFTFCTFACCFSSNKI